MWLEKKSVKLKKIVYKFNFIFSSGLITDISKPHKPDFTRMSLKSLSLNMLNIFSARRVLLIKVCTSADDIITTQTRNPRGLFRFSFSLALHTYQESLGLCTYPHFIWSSKYLSQSILSCTITIAQQLPYFRLTISLLWIILIASKLVSTIPSF